LSREISHTGSPKREMSRGKGNIPGNVPGIVPFPGNVPWEREMSREMSLGQGIIP